MGRESDCVWFVALNWAQALRNGDHKNDNTHTHTHTQNKPLREMWCVRVHGKMKLRVFQKQRNCIVSGCLAFSWFHIGSETSNVLKISLLLVPLMIIAMGCLSSSFCVYSIDPLGAAMSTHTHTYNSCSS
jgi:hypothetical protein